jgi:DNA-binding IscR family transcriptional regulator
MREVIEAIDGPVHLNVCLISVRACGRSKWCPAHTVWVEAQRAMLDVLSGAVIEDLAKAVTEEHGRVVATPVFAELNRNQA